MFGEKYHQENAKNEISERLDFETFWRSMPPEPLKRSRLRRFRILPRLLEKSGYGPEATEREIAFRVESSAAFSVVPGIRHLSY